jgi:tRNA threonylcarbamoyladenosine biosynthesis protein TsaE
MTIQDVITLMQNPAIAQIALANVSQATLLAKRFAQLLEQQAKLFDKAPWVIFLDGDLGTGKTTFVRAVLQTLGEKGKIKSPTYTILESYTIQQWQLFHLDLYRLADAEELHFLGLEDHFTANAIFFVEWPKKGGAVLPHPDIVLHYKFLAQGRTLEMTAFSQRAVPLLESVHEIYV